MFTTKKKIFILKIVAVIECFADSLLLYDLFIWLTSLRSLALLGLIRNRCLCWSVISFIGSTKLLPATCIGISTILPLNLQVTSEIECLIFFCIAYFQACLNLFFAIARRQSGQIISISIIAFYDCRAAVAFYLTNFPGKFTGIPVVAFVVAVVCFILRGVARRSWPTLLSSWRFVVY